MNSPKVSILVPVYNVEKFLPRCLHSLFTQSYQNTEYVFVDDASTDDSLRVLHEELESHAIPKERYRIIHHPVNKGIATSRKDCVANAHGDYVQFVDSDDWIEKNMTEELVTATRGSSVDIVGCYYVKDYENHVSTFHKEDYSNSTAENMMRSLNYDISTVLWKLLVRRSLFDRFSINDGIDISEDYIISIKLFYFAQTFSFVPKFMYHYVQFNQGCVSLQTEKSVLNHVKAVRVVESFLDEKHLLTPKVVHLLKLRKFNIKSNFLTSKLYDLNAYREVFPEANKMWREMGYSRNEKIKFWLAEKHLYAILNLLIHLKYERRN